jgi:DNA polymerase-3 subunit beta
MKFDIDRDVFASALARAAGVAGHDEAMPVLRNVMLRAAGAGEIELLATDLELSIKTGASASVHDQGVVLVPAKELLAIVRSLLDASFSVQLKENRLTLISGKSKRSLATMPSEDFPALDLDETQGFEPCDRVALAKAISKTIYAVPGKEDPFSVPGLFIHTQAAGSMRCVATDGHRLAHCDLSEGALGSMRLGRGIVISRKGIIEISKMLDTSQEISLALSDKSLLVKSPKTLLSIRPMASDFVDYEAIIPEERPSSMTFDRDAMQRRIKSLAVLRDIKWAAIGFHGTAGNLVLDVRYGDLGEASDELPVDYEGDEFRVHMNMQYLAQILGSSSSDLVRMEWLDGMHGIIFKEVSDPDAFHLVMPMVV